MAPKVGDSFELVHAAFGCSAGTYTVTYVSQYIVRFFGGPFQMSRFLFRGSFDYLWEHGFIQLKEGE